MATIGSVVLNLKSNSAQFSKGIRSAKKDVGGLMSFIKSAGPVIAGALAAIGGAAAIKGIASLTLSVIDGVDAQWKLATALGMSTQKLQELQAIAGADANLGADEFNASLKKMVNVIGEAAMGTGPARAAFERLGLDLQQLSAMTPDQQFRAIAEAVSKMKSPLEQSVAAIDIFGKSGQQLLPLLQAGGAGLDAAAEKARNFGQALSDTDNAKLVIAKQGIEEIQRAVTGMGMQWAVAVSPYIIEATNQILALMPTAEQVKAFFVGAMRVIGAAVGVVADGFQWLRIGVVAGATLMINNWAMQAQAIYSVAEAAIWLYNKITRSNVQLPSFVRGINAELQGLAKGMQEELKSVWNEEMPSKKIDAFFSNIEARADNAANKLVNETKPKITEGLVDAYADARKKIADILDGLNNDIATFGMDSLDKQLFDLRNIAGVKPEEIAKAEAAVAKLRELQKGAELKDAGKSLTESLQTPLEKYKAEIAKFDELLAAQAISQETYARATAKAQQDLLGSMNIDEGGRKSQMITRRFDFRMPDEKKTASREEQMVKLAEKQAELAKRQLAKLDAIASGDNGIEIVEHNW